MSQPIRCRAFHEGHECVLDRGHAGAHEDGCGPSRYVWDGALCGYARTESPDVPPFVTPSLQHAEPFVAQRAMAQQAAMDGVALCHAPYDASWSCALAAGHWGHHYTTGWDARGRTWPRREPASGADEVLDWSLSQAQEHTESFFKLKTGPRAPSAPERVDAAVRYLEELAQALDDVEFKGEDRSYTEFSAEARDLRALAKKLALRAKAVRAVAGVATP